MGCNLSILLRVDTEFFHSRKESRAVHSQARGSTVGAAHAPLARSQCPYDLIALPSFIFVSSATFVIWRICSFSSDWFNFVQVSTHECFRIGFRSSASGASSDLPLVRITARSMKFSSSRILPGQSQVLIQEQVKPLVFLAMKFRFCAHGYAKCPPI